MNGVHDMGGMQNMGPVPYDRNEPVFHAVWEGRVYAMNRAAGAFGKWNIDASRYVIELIQPAEYLRMSYYERWHERLVELLIQRGLVTRNEIESGKPCEGSPKATPVMNSGNLPLVPANPERPNANVVARFKSGERVRARNINPAGHTRSPRYARGKHGTVVRDHGIFVFPDTNALFEGEKPQHVYSVRFTARELWGEQASPIDTVHLDMWDDYLEPV